MILVSCRRDFDSNQRFSKEIEIRDYPFLPALDRFTTLTPETLTASTAGRRVLVLVHGFRNPLENVGAAYAEVEKALLNHGIAGYDVVLGFLWPGFATALGFFPAVPFASRSASFFRTFMQAIAGSAQVDVQTHSLGARVALQALVFPGEVRVDNLLLTAAAVDDESLEPVKEFNASLASAARCFVYHSSRDPVLKIGYRIGSLDKALGYKGPQDPAVIAHSCPNVFVIDCSEPVRSHGGYRKSAQVFEHWRRVVENVPLAQFEQLDADVVVA